MHVKKNDLVEVIAGEDAVKGRAHRVLRVLPTVNKVVVEGVNRVYKHVKPNKRNPQGGRLSVEAPMAASNVMLFCPNCKKRCQNWKESCGWKKIQGMQEVQG